MSLVSALAKAVGTRVHSMAIASSSDIILRFIVYFPSLLIVMVSRQGSHLSEHTPNFWDHPTTAL